MSITGTFSCFLEGKTVMGYFEDRFRDHTVHQTIANCLELFKSHELDELDESDVIAITRSEHVVKFAKTMLNSCDADL